MATTFVGIHNQGFWMRDGLLELWLRLLALHIEEPTEEDTLLRQIRDGWLLASRGYFTGCVPVDLEEHLATAEGQRIVLQAIESLLQALQQDPGELDKRTLNLMGLAGEFTQNLKSHVLVEIGEAFLKLLNGHDFGPASGSQMVPAES